MYWNIDFEEDLRDLLHYKLSSYDDFNSSRLSILGMSQLYDPSSRRSTLLYMLENQSQNNLLTDSGNKSKIKKWDHNKRECIKKERKKKGNKGKFALKDNQKSINNMFLLKDIPTQSAKIFFQM